MTLPIMDMDDLLNLTGAVLQAKRRYVNARAERDPLLFIAHAEYRAAGKALEQFNIEHGISQERSL